MKQLTVFLLILAFGVGSVLSQTPVKNVDGNRNELIIGTYGSPYEVAITTLTNSAVAVTTSTVYVQALHCNNTTAGAVTFTMENTAGTDYFTAVSIPANGVLTANYYARGIKFVGIKWNASANSSINCTLTGISQ